MKHRGSNAEHIDDRLQPLLFFQTSFEVFRNRAIVPPIELDLYAIRG
jgi:hypothetical protein